MNLTNENEHDSGNIVTSNSKNEDKIIVFVGSTKEDLVEYRDEVHQALIILRQQLKNQLDVEAMEIFFANPKESHELCLERVTSSDIYVCIVAHRYGSLFPGEDISYTEKEYRTALDLGKDVLGYIIDSQHPINPKYIDNRNKQKLDDFKQLVSRKTRSIFTTPQDLAEQVYINVSEILATKDLSTPEIKSVASELKHFKLTKPKSENFKSVKETINSMINKVKELEDDTGNLIQSALTTDNLPSALYTTIKSEILLTEHEAEINDAAELTKSGFPDKALESLNKLKSRIFDKCNDSIKYKTHINLGNALMGTNRVDDAAREYIAAFQYNKNDNKAKLNKALGHILLYELPAASKLINEVLKIDSNNISANAFLIRSFTLDKDIEDVIKLIPENIRDKEEIAKALADFSVNKNDNKNAIKWYRIALLNSKDKSDIDVKGALGFTILKSVAESPEATHKLNVTDDLKKYIQEGITLIDEVWKVLEGTNKKNFRSDYLLARASGKRIIGDIKGAINDIDLALKIDLDNPHYIKLKAILSFEDKDILLSKQYFEKIINNKNFPEVALMLAEALSKSDDSNQIQDAIKILDEIQVSNREEKYKVDAKRIQVGIFLKKDEVDKAIEKVNEVRNVDVTNVLYATDASKVFRKLQKDDESISVLEDVVKYVDKKTPTNHLHELANEFYVLKSYGNASRIYEMFVDTSLNNELTYKLAYSYLKNGDFDKCNKICEEIRHKYGVVKSLSEIEVGINVDINALPKAKAICKDITNKYPEDFTIKLKLAVINFRISSPESLIELDNFLQGKFDVTKISIEDVELLAQLMFARGISNANYYLKSFNLMYEMRRSNSGNGIAHAKYHTFFLPRSNKIKELLKPETVKEDCAVLIDLGGDRKNWFVIDDRKDLNEGEINLENDLSKKLLGKKKGEEIDQKLLNVVEKRKIIDIKSKYLHAFHETESRRMSLPELADVHLGSLANIETPEDLEKEMRTIVQSLGMSADKRVHANKLYKTGQISLECFSKLSDVDFFNIWSYVTSSKGIRFHCCSGHTKELDFALSLLINKSPFIVADLVSILTIYISGAGDSIVKKYGKLNISQSVVDVLNTKIYELSVLEGDVTTVSIPETGRISGVVTTKKQNENNLNFLKDILNWVLANCNPVVPTNEALSINRNIREQLENVVGEVSVNSMLIAKENDGILLSDDQLLRHLAKSQFKVNGIWTQATSLALLEGKNITQEEYNDISANLAQLNFFHTRIDSNILIYAAKKAGWTLAEPYLSVASILRGNNSSIESALIVAVDFLYLLYKSSEVVPNSRYIWILNILDNITANRNPTQVLKSFASLVEQKFIILQPAVDEIISLIEVWRKQRMIT